MIIIQVYKTEREQPFSVTVIKPQADKTMQECVLSNVRHGTREGAMSYANHKAKQYDTPYLDDFTDFISNL